MTFNIPSRTTFEVKLPEVFGHIPSLLVVRAMTPMGNYVNAWPLFITATGVLKILDLLFVVISIEMYEFMLVCVHNLASLDDRSHLFIDYYRLP